MSTDPLLFNRKDGQESLSWEMTCMSFRSHQEQGSVACFGALFSRNYAPIFGKTPNGMFQIDDKSKQSATLSSKCDIIAMKYEPDKRRNSGIIIGGKVRYRYKYTLSWNAVN